METEKLNILLLKLIGLTTACNFNGAHHTINNFPDVHEAARDRPPRDEDRGPFRDLP